ncbi:MAG: helix-turn-helix domain-containing protein [Candidatus Aminicenantes bacterium]|nr:helix-turn-helix domain-containing protein [Candidatus Aminicenantes bacterium]
MPIVINGIGRVFTVKDLMELLHVSDITVRRYYRAGKLKGQKFGKNVYFTESALKDFLEGKTSEKEDKKQEEDKKTKDEKKPGTNK